MIAASARRQHGRETVARLRPNHRDTRGGFSGDPSHHMGARVTVADEHESAGYLIRQAPCQVENLIQPLSVPEKAGEDKHGARLVTEQRARRIIREVFPETGRVDHHL